VQDYFSDTSVVARPRRNKRSDQVKGFVVLPKRWIVWQTPPWLVVVLCAVAGAALGFR